MYQFKKRLDALEQAEHSRSRCPAMTPALLLSYATPAERADWEAAGRPTVDWATWQQVLDWAYADE